MRSRPARVGSLRPVANSTVAAETRGQKQRRVALDPGRVAGQRSARSAFFERIRVAPCAARISGMKTPRDWLRVDYLRLPESESETQSTT